MTSSILTNLRAAAHKRSRYQKTKFEIETMPLDVALDLDIYRGDAARIARKAVYGA